MQSRDVNTDSNGIYAREVTTHSESPQASTLQNATFAAFNPQINTTLSGIRPSKQMTGFRGFEFTIEDLQTM